MGNDQNEIQVTIDQAREQIKLKEALDRLHKNKDFLLVIKTEYLGKEPSRNTFLLSDPSQQSPEQQKAIFDSIRGVSELHSFFRRIEHGALVANRTLDEHLALEQGEEV